MSVDAEQLWMLRQEVEVLKDSIIERPAERMIEDCVHQGVYRQHIARYRFSVPYLGANHLDMACGTGYGAYFLAQQEPVQQVTAVDLDSDAVRYARLRYGKSNLQFRCEDACTDWADTRFDSMTSFETIEHVPYPDRMLEQIVRMLSPEGALVISTPIRTSGALRDRPSWPYHLREWSRQEFESLLSLFFDDVQTYGQLWSLRQKYGPLGVGQKTVRRWLKRSGLADDAIEGLAYDVLPGKSVPKQYLNPFPQFGVFVCRKPHQCADQKSLLRLAYGKASGD